MSTSFRVQAPAGVLVLDPEESRGASRPGRNRMETRDPDSSFGLACRDVLDEVRQRMMVRGYRWE